MPLEPQLVDLIVAAVIEHQPLDLNGTMLVEPQLVDLIVIAVTEPQVLDLI